MNHELPAIRGHRDLRGFTLLLICHLNFLTTAAFSQSATGWKAKWDKVLGSAKKEATVVIWGPRGDIIRNALVQVFTKAIGEIDVEYLAASGSEFAAKARAERAAGLYSVDVVLAGSTTAIWYFKPMGALEPIEPILLLPEVTEGKNWREGRLEFSDEPRRTNLVFVTHAQFPVIYDPAQVKADEVDELSDLLEPKVERQIYFERSASRRSGKFIFPSHLGEPRAGQGNRLLQKTSRPNRRWIATRGASSSG